MKDYLCISDSYAKWPARVKSELDHKDRRGGCYRPSTSRFQKADILPVPVNNPI